MPLRRIAVSLTLVLLGAVPSRTWPMYQYHADHNAVFAAREPPYHWRYAAGAKINGGLAISADRLYVETFAPSVVAIDRTTGRRLWERKLPDTAMTTPIVADGLVVVGTGTARVGSDKGGHLIWSRPQGDQIVAFEARSGRLRWRYTTVGEDMPSPALVRVGARDAIVFANGDDHVRALDLRNGKLIWAATLSGISSMASAAASGGLVYVLAGNDAASHRPNYVYAVRASNGAIAWKAPYGNADASPALLGGRLFVEDSQTTVGPPDRNSFNDVYALDGTSGRLLWERESALGFLTKIASNEQAIAGMIDRGVLFVSLPAARRFGAFNAETGRTLWSLRTAAAVKMSAVAFGGRVYVGDTAGVLYVLSEGDGRVLARRRFGAPFSCSSPVLVGATLYVADGTNVLALPLARFVR